MSGRNRLICLAILLTVVAVGTAGIVLHVLYMTAVNQQQERLVDSARSQAWLMEAVARYDLEHYRDHHTRDNAPLSDESVAQLARVATLSQFEDFHEQSGGFGETGEFLLAGLDTHSVVGIHWTHSGRHCELEPTADHSDVAEAIRRALNGESGMTMGLDCRGETVLMAYEPVPIMKLGIVAKIDLAEVRKPFVRAGVVALGAGLVLILIGAVTFLMIGGPLVGRMEESERKYRTLFENAPIGISVSDFSGRLIYANPSLLKMTGRTPGDSETWNVRNYYKDPVDRERILKELRQNGCVRDCEVSMLRSDGSGFEASIAVETVRIGGQDSILSMIWDVTEQKRSAKNLRESEERYRSLVENAQDAIFTVSIDGTVTSLNQAFTTYTGFEGDEWIGRPFEDLIHPDDQAGARENFARLLKGESRPVHELRVATRSGEYLMGELRVSVLHSQGQTIGFLGIARDVTERHRANDILRESEAFNRAVIEHSPLGITVRSLKGKLLSANEAWQRIWDVSDETLQEYLTNDPAKLNFDDRDRCLGEWMPRIKKIYEDGGLLHIPEVYLDVGDSNTRTRWVALTYYSIDDADGNVDRIVILTSDITERKRVEEELSKAQKLESIGVLAGGIAHDFNNILTGVVGNVSLAKEDVDPASETFESLDSAEVALGRARELTQQLLTFSRGGAPVRKTASVADIIRESCRFSLHGSNVRCELDLPDDLKPVDVDAGQISQTLNNLIINADQAMPDGGVVTISAANVCLDVHSGLPLPAASYVRILVIDTGSGIPPEQVGRIFDPFFTTKKKGSGLGLASAYSIVANHGGYIHCESQPGRGTIFSLYLPALGQAALEPVEAEKIAAAGNGRVLIMDDEELIRDVTGRILTRLGYRVELAADGARAIALYSQGLASGDRFDLVVLDLTIPGGMGGRETMRELRRIDPEVKALVCSGYSNDPTLSDFDECGFRAVVSKPFKPSDLAHTVRDLIQSGQD